MGRQSLDLHITLSYRRMLPIALDTFIPIKSSPPEIATELLLCARYSPFLVPSVKFLLEVRLLLTDSVCIFDSQDELTACGFGE